MRYPNVVEFKVYGDYALFSDPITRVGGEKCSYQVPTYEAIKGVLSSVYWKPTFLWVIDRVRVMKQIRTEVKGVRPVKYNGGSELSYYTYLKDVEYHVSAHFEWNENRPELSGDRNENKHHEIAKRMIEKGGRRDIFLGTRECQAYVEPCAFNDGTSVYDHLERLDFGLMYHGVTYADEAYNEETAEKMTLNFWRACMINGVIDYPAPSECPLHKPLHKTSVKEFGADKLNFSGVCGAGEAE